MPVPFPIDTLSTTRFDHALLSQNPALLFLAVLSEHVACTRTTFLSLECLEADVIAFRDHALYRRQKCIARTPTAHPLTVPFFSVPSKTRMPTPCRPRPPAGRDGGRQLTVCPLRLRVAPAKTFKTPKIPLSSERSVGGHTRSWSSVYPPRPQDGTASDRGSVSGAYQCDHHSCREDSAMRMRRPLLGARSSTEPRSGHWRSSRGERLKPGEEVSTSCPPRGCSEVP